MKKIYSLLALCLFITGNAQIINFPDANFKARLLDADISTEVAKNLAGDYFKIDSNNDGEIEVSEALQVSWLNASFGLIDSLTGIENFTNLQYLDCSSNLGYCYDCNPNSIETLDVSNLAILKTLKCNGNQMNSLNISGLTNIEYLDCYRNKLQTLDITSAINILYLDYSQNQLSSLDTNSLINIKYLKCGSNQMTSISVSNLINLEYLDFGYNQISSIDLNGLNNLIFLNCSENQFSSLDASMLTNLTHFICFSNQLTTLDVSNLVLLKFLNFSDNQITTIDLSNLTTLETLGCSANLLSYLDINELHFVEDLYCDNNTTLEYLFMKNGIDKTTLDFSNNPNLKYICTDNQINLIQDLITTYSYTNCHVNTYCTFVPGGDFYTIQGNNRFDNDNNGCNVSDIPASNLNFSITNGTVTGNIISNETGNYSIPVQAGTHTITPILENPTYFNVSPTNAIVDFPTQASPFTQDFCITANGIHPDLEITLLPTTPARPGFDANYKIIYKNKGTTTQSGSVNLTFDDAVLDFVSASPSTTTQSTNNLSWDFTNLLPFETREIELTSNVNAPTDTPAVNNGDILDFTATITSPATDETPNDNTFAFHQTVVGSYDPNDKTCLEGTIIAPEMVGEYVHYVIRFENTGTFPAQNIIVKDMIDTAKFDINTLIPIKGSHEFVTKISDTNKVEFIFENINLPFDNATNDGYVAFKIKTKSSLVVGDTFTNTANIYFDYNFPIVTDPATTTVQTLGKSDFEFAKYFTVYPNPASSTLNLSVKSGIALNSIAIYNTLGQLVIAVPNAQSVSYVDVSNLKTGYYFIKMITDKGSSNTRFVKD